MRALVWSVQTGHAVVYDPPWLQASLVSRGTAGASVDCTTSYRYCVPRDRLRGRGTTTRSVRARWAGRVKPQSAHLDGRDLPRSAFATASDKLPFELQFTTMILHTHRSPKPVRRPSPHPHQSDGVSPNLPSSDRLPLSNGCRIYSTHTTTWMWVPHAHTTSPRTRHLTHYRFTQRQ